MVIGRDVFVRALRAPYFVGALTLVACAEAPGEGAPLNQPGHRAEDGRLRDSGDAALHTDGGAATGFGTLRLELPVPARAAGEIEYEITGHGPERWAGAVPRLSGTEKAVAVVSLPEAQGYFLDIAVPLHDDARCRGLFRFDITTGDTTAFYARLPCGGDMPAASEPVLDSGSSTMNNYLQGTVVPDAQVKPSGDGETSHPPSVPGDATAESEDGFPEAGPAPSPDAGYDEAVDAGSDSLPEGGQDAASPVAGGSDSQVEACEACSAHACTELLADCSMATGTISSGPAQGRAWSDVCAALVTCAHEMHCVSSNPLECYCGWEPDAVRRCVKRAEGPCREAFEAAAETADPREVIAKVENGELSFGIASRIIACEAERCGEECVDY